MKRERESARARGKNREKTVHETQHSTEIREVPRGDRRQSLRQYRILLTVYREFESRVSVAELKTSAAGVKRTSKSKKRSSMLLHAHKEKPS